MAIELVQMMDHGMCLEIVGFSEEEGVRFGTPFLGSLALVGGLDDTFLARRDAAGTTVEQAIRDSVWTPRGCRKRKWTRYDRVFRVSHRAGPGARRPQPPARSS